MPTSTLHLVGRRFDDNRLRSGVVPKLMATFPHLLVNGIILVLRYVLNCESVMIWVGQEVPNLCDEAVN
jgi:hypothetical protein